MSKHSNTLSVSNHKGGVGKTTSAVNIAAGLHALGYRVLLIDMDPQANLSQSLGITNPQRSIYTALRGQSRLQPILIKEGLDLVPSTLDLSGAEVELSAEAGREFILSGLIDDLPERYQFVIIDTPPSLGLLTLNAFTASEGVIIPLQAQYLALQGLTKLTEVIDKVRQRLNKRLHLSGVLITQYDRRKILSRNIEAAIRQHFGELVYQTVIRDNVALAEAPAQAADIFTYQPDSNGAKDYKALCSEIIQRSKL